VEECAILWPGCRPTWALERGPRALPVGLHIWDFSLPKGLIHFLLIGIHHIRDTGYLRGLTSQGADIIPTKYVLIQIFSHKEI
jgi:hypothetical protein